MPTPISHIFGEVFKLPGLNDPRTLSPIPLTIIDFDSEVEKQANPPMITDTTKVTVVFLIDKYVNYIEVRFGALMAYNAIVKPQPTTSSLA